VVYIFDVGFDVWDAKPEALRQGGLWIVRGDLCSATLVRLVSSDVSVCTDMEAAAMPRSCACDRARVSALLIVAL
jgi:hypothetical protein